MEEVFTGAPEPLVTALRANPTSEVMRHMVAAVISQSIPLNVQTFDELTTFMKGLKDSGRVFDWSKLRKRKAAPVPASQRGSDNDTLTVYLDDIAGTVDVRLTRYDRFRGSLPCRLRRQELRTIYEESNSSSDFLCQVRERVEEIINEDAYVYDLPHIDSDDSDDQETIDSNFDFDDCSLSNTSQTELEYVFDEFMAEDNPDEDEDEDEDPDEDPDEE